MSTDPTPTDRVAARLAADRAWQQSRRRRRLLRLGRTVAVAVIVPIGAWQLWPHAAVDAVPLSVATTGPGTAPASPATTTTDTTATDIAAGPTDAAPTGQGTAYASADDWGAPPPPTTPWVAPTKVGLNDPVPGTMNLQPVMADAYDRAVVAAQADGVSLPIRSGWRSPEFQQVLFDRAVRTYGSAEAAAQWVKPPAESAHVQGLAVDIDSRAGARWLDEHGAAFGLCRIYTNEWWHFEYRQGPCPAPLADASG